MKNIEERLSAVRMEMAADNLDAFLVPRADEYLGEYVPEHNERLRWISGFSGSAGTVVVLKDSAAVFVDGRYTIQVQQQVSGDLFEFHHLIEDPPLGWIGSKLKRKSRVGIDTRLHPYSFFKTASAAFLSLDIELVEVSPNPIDQHWNDRVIPEPELALLLGEDFTGEHSSK